MQHFRNFRKSLNYSNKSLKLLPTVSILQSGVLLLMAAVISNETTTTKKEEATAHQISV